VNADNRLSALGGLKKTAVTAAPSVPAAEPAPVPATPRQDPQPPAAPVRSVPSRPEPASAPLQVKEASDTGSARYTSVTLRTPKDLDARLVAHHERTRLSYPNIIMNAIDATYDALPGILAAQQHAVPAANLFGRPETVAQVASDDSDKAIRPVRMLRNHVQIIDGISDELANSNRTRLINAALTEYLKDERTS